MNKRELLAFFLFFSFLKICQILLYFIVDLWYGARDYLGRKVV